MEKSRKTLKKSSFWIHYTAYYSFMIETHTSTAHTFIKKGFWLYLFSFVIAPSGYIIKIILSGDLSVSEVGTLYGVMSFMLLFGAFNDFGMTESLGKFIPQYIVEKAYHKVKTVLFYALSLQCITGILLFFVFWFGADFISATLFKNLQTAPIIQVFAFFFFGNNILQVTSNFFLAVQNTFVQKLCEFLRMLFVVLFVLFGSVTTFGDIVFYSRSWVLGIYVGILVSSLFFLRKYYLPYLRKERIFWDAELFTKLFKYGFFVFLGAQVTTLVGQIDMQMILYILDTVEAWYYSNYLSLIGIPFVVIGPIFALIFPVFSQMYAQKKEAEIKQTKQFLVKYMLIGGIMSSVFLWSFGDTLSVVLFGEKFQTSGFILQWSAPFLVCNLFLQINFSILAAIGKVQWRLYIMLWALVLNTILNIIFILKFGVFWAALATWIGWVFIYLSTEAVLPGYRLRIKPWFFWKNLLTGWLLLGVFWYIGFTDSRFWNMWILFVLWVFCAGVFALVNISECRVFLRELQAIRRK